MHRKVPHPLQTITPPFPALSRAEFQAVQCMGTVVDRAPACLVCTQAHGDQLGVVLRGELLAGRGDVVVRLGPGDCFGTGSLKTHDGQIFALTQASVLVFDRRELATMVRQCPRLYAVLTAGCGDSAPTGCSLPRPTPQRCVPGTVRSRR
jgi:hypothetical protein